MTDQVRVRVDPSRCVGSGTCVAIAPDDLELLDGVARARRAATVLSPELQDAVDSCPVEALSIEPASEQPRER